MSGQTIRRQLANYAKLSRISNLPTCWTNVLVGCAIGAGGSALPWWRVIGVSVAVSLLYAAGMAMNDAVDAKQDRATAPHRPIPSGRVSLRGAWLFSGIASITALGLLALIGSVALGAGAALLIFVTGYNVLHKRLAIAVVLMGLCRGWVIVIAYAAMIPVVGPRLETDSNTTAALPWFVLVLMLYITAVTFVAQTEHQRWTAMRHWIALLFPPLILLLAMSIEPTMKWWTIVAAIAVTAWLVWAAWLVVSQPPQISRAVLAWLSGICLIDAYFLTLLDRPGVALIAAFCFMITVWAHRYIRGT